MGTHTEIFAASLYLKHPIFVAVCKNSVQQEYYWAKYQCLPTPGNDVVFPDQSFVQLPQGIKHSFELCHVIYNHYDCVVLISDKSFSLIPPHILVTRQHPCHMLMYIISNMPCSQYILFHSHTLIKASLFCVIMMFYVILT